MRMAIKEPGKKIKLVETTEKYRTDACKVYTGEKHRVEYVRLNQEGTLCMAVNEEGLPLGLETNFYMNMNNPVFPIQRIVGTVCFVRHKYVNVYEEEIWDYEVEDITDEDLKYICNIFTDDYQKETEFLFHLVGGY